jgi:predicted dehydrogenase
VVQDVVTSPPRKWARVQGTSGYVEWHCGYRPNADAVLWQFGDGKAQQHIVAKTRPDDFIQELRHIAETLAAGATSATASPLSLRSGLDTMLVIAAAHRSARSGRSVKINYEAGADADALSDC